MCLVCGETEPGLCHTGHHRSSEQLGHPFLAIHEVCMFHEGAVLQEQERKEKFMEEHPRYGQWSGITREELEKLVWSMPTVQVAKLYGVSDSAVGKRCRALGISKPARGFWAQVKSGRRPHPEGKPQKNEVLSPAKP